MYLKIEDILECTNGILLTGNKKYECVNFSKDTRTIQENDIYIGIKGENFDGNLFWKDALNKGASTVIINKIVISQDDLNKYSDKNIVQVEDTKKALIQIATAKRELYKDLIVVGITGSVGKTSTKDIISSVLSQKYITLKTEGNNNNDIGLPFTILKLKDEQVAVIEMGMNHLGEISTLTKIAKPTLSVITNVGTSHIGNLGSRENILKAKLEILEGMEEKNIIINNDNDLLNNWYTENKDRIHIHTFGINKPSNCMANNIIKEENESTFECNINGNLFKETIPVGGDVFVLNALCASLIGNLLGLTNVEIQKGILNIELTKKRMEIIKLKNGTTLINDAYNASFESIKASLEYLTNTNANRKIAVLGDIFELGDYAEKIHRKVGKEIANNSIDLLFAIGENSKYIVEEAINNGMNNENIYYINNKEDLIEKIKQSMKSNDYILFKASNGMKLFDIVEKLKQEI